ncbi:hypothetical protein EJ05DRAFT_478822 [Pseudovirgaria hyperparasitica]|uniref:MARVEL domain-containing protein n=1 Tax=Pseudovirgaria hyperparasitica TaxID=470096 RepID=A0A6A6VWN2_9PEZI|nr:uncharacterized protein EJ05DRAFT_478822 [Pseudovirgaria hyperparasitica]KAF2755002.1 hypothetical protein EJ05DRAFT_478822 [Pseudovirgaria hyperparasitica]
MPVPSYGAAPLSKTFLATRALQVVAMIGIVGMTANFVNNIVTTGKEAPKEIVGTLSITCLATLYCAISVAFFWSEANLGLLVMTGVDSLLLIAFIVCAVTVGKPLSYLNCYVIGNASAEVDAQSAWAFAMAITSNLNTMGSKLDLSSWVGATKANCLESKAIWGLCIALCILFTTSSVLLPTCWYKNRKAGAGFNKYEDA